MARIFALLALATSTLLSAGCSGSAPTGTVDGTVMLGGQGIPAQVAFKSETASVSGVSDASGNFTLYNGESTAIPTGTYQVAISDAPSDSTPSDEDYEAMMQGGGNQEVPESKIPTKYQSFGTSGLEFTVEEGENNFEITLE